MHRSIGMTFDVTGIKSSFHPISRPVAELSCLISRFGDPGFVTPIPKKCVANLARLTTTKSDDHLVGFGWFKVWIAGRLIALDSSHKLTHILCI